MVARAAQGNLIPGKKLDGFLGEHLHGFQAGQVYPGLVLL
jgi:hypothetical protein